MTREKQIEQYCSEQGFPYGACSSISSVKATVATEAIKWADETMIKKACEYLYEWNKRQVLKYGSRGNLRCLDYTISVYDFKKAMEE